MKLAILGVRTSFGAGHRGTERAPQTIRGAGLRSRLEHLGHVVEDLPDILPPDLGQPGRPRLEKVNDIRTTVLDIFEAVSRIPLDVVPIILGGSHTLSLGTVPATARRRDPIGLLWVDAHADFNTRDTSPSDNIHGMVLAALAGVGELSGIVTATSGYSPKRLKDRIVVLGARAIDRDDANNDDERRLLSRHGRYGVHIENMKSLWRPGFEEAIETAVWKATHGGAALHVSVDIDVVDPSEAPGTVEQEPGGLSTQQACQLMRLIAKSGTICSLEIVAVNPALDRNQMTSRLACDLICAAFGG